jgi:hypothetical protein
MQSRQILAEIDFNAPFMLLGRLLPHHRLCTVAGLLCL